MHDLRVPAPPVGDPSAPAVHISVVDARQFQVDPPDSDIPSLMNASEVSDPRVRSRAFGRKRGSFGGARGDFLLPEGHTVQDVVESVVGSAFRRRGYRVLDRSADDAIAVEVTIRELWSYFRPGAFKVAVHFTARLEIRAEGLIERLEVTAEDELRKGAMTDDRWIQLVEHGLGVLETRVAQRLPPASAGQSAAASGGGRAPPAPAQQSTTPSPCSEAWFAQVEARFPVSDSQGHGPDPGSDEWMRALEHQRGLSELDLSDPGTEAWCEQVDRQLFPE